MIGNNYINLNKDNNFAAKQNNTHNNAGSTPAFKGGLDKLANFGKHHFDFCGIEMPFIALPFYTFGIVLTSRILKARDENEKREVFTRDAVTISTILFGVPVLNKLFAKLSRNALNMPISLKPDVKNQTTAQRILSPIKNIWGEDLAGFDRLKHWYKYDRSISKENFLKNLEAIGKKGNDKSLAALFRFASNFFDDKLNNTLKKAFEINNISELKNKTNADFIKILTSETSENAKAVFNHLAEKENGLLKAAKIIKSIPGVGNIAIIASMLGIFIPWFNIHRTKKVMAAKLKDSKIKNIINNNNNQPNKSSNIPTAPIKLNNFQQTLFKNFIN